MPIRRYRKDPRGTTEQRADKNVRQLFERGDFLKVGPAIEREAVDRVQNRPEERRSTVARLGTELGVLRRAHRLTQEQVAGALGTKKTNVSRLDSGQYGGLTIEHFPAVPDAFIALERARAQERRAA